MPLTNKKKKKSFRKRCANQPAINHSQHDLNGNKKENQIPSSEDAEKNFFFVVLICEPRGRRSGWGERDSV